MTTRRPARPDDAGAVLAMWQRHQTAVLGHPDSTLDDARDALTSPSLDPWSLVVLDDARVLGCALVLREEDGSVDLDVVVDPDADDLLAPLLREALDRAAADGEVTATQPCYRPDVRTAQVLTSLGFAPATTFLRMRRELDGPVEVDLPGGVVVEPPGEHTDDVLRRAHRLHTETFRGHFGFVERSYDDWREAHLARADRGRLWFATVDGEDAGFLHETDQFVEDEDAGYVWRLGVLPAARGRGIAAALLLAQFAAARERGRRAVLLHVDSSNATGATRLYERVGMTAVLVLDMWRTTWSGGGGGTGVARAT